MRTLFSILLLLIILALALPFAGGYYFKTQYLQLIEEFNRNNTDQIVITDYQLGWFQSHVKVEVKSQAPDSLIVSATLDQDIKHGPLIFDFQKNKFYFKAALVQSFMYLPKEYEDILFKGKTNKYILQIDSLVDYYSEDWDSHLTMPELSVDIFSLAKLNWEGMQGTSLTQINKNRVTSVKSNLMLGKLTIESLFFQFLMQPGTVNTMVSYTDGLTDNLDVEFNFPVIYAAMPFEKEIQYVFYLKDLTIKQQMMSQGNKVAINIINKASALDARIYISPVKNMEINLSLNNMDLAAVREIQKNMKKITDKTYAQHVNKINELLNACLANSIVLLKINFSTLLGNFQANAQINLPNKVSLHDGLADQSNITLELRVGVGLFNKTIEQFYALPAAAAPDAVTQAAKTKDEMIKLVQQGYITQNNNDYIILLTKSPMGALKLNGKDIPTSGFENIADLFSLLDSIIFPEKASAAAALFGRIQAIMAAADSLKASTGNFSKVNTSTVSAVLTPAELTTPWGGTFNISPNAAASGIIINVVPPPSAGICQLFLKQMVSFKAIHVNETCSTIEYKSLPANQANTSNNLSGKWQSVNGAQLVELSQEGNQIKGTWRQSSRVPFFGTINGNKISMTFPDDRVYQATFTGNACNILWEDRNIWLKDGCQ